MNKNKLIILIISIFLLNNVFIEVKAMEKFLLGAGFALSMVAAGTCLVKIINDPKEEMKKEKEDAVNIVLEAVRQDGWIADDNQFESTKNRALLRLGLGKLE